MIVDNLVHFSRVLRRAGLQVGPDRVLSAVAAVETVGVQRREDLHAALSAVMLDRHEQQAIFDAAFDAFFRDPKLLERLMYLMLPKVSGRGQAERAAQGQRLAEALSAPREKPERPAAPDNGHDEVQFDTTFSFSERERLQRADFESMTTAEYALARALAQRLPPPVQPVRRRRHEASSAGATIDLRRTLQRMVRTPHALAPVCTQPRRELPPLVVLLDISGSMDRYARLFLHYLHGLVRHHVRVQVFTFGTRLTNVSRALRHRDPDAALRAAEEQVSDWKGGTRIGACLDTFNRRWARRVLGANAAVLLVTDGLDRDDQGALAQAAEQLHRLAHEVVWLNPLLRFEGFEPRAAGVRALLPHVDRFLPVHNLASLADLGRALRAPAVRPATLLRPRPRA
ncbi:MAG: hypothetical protein RI988_577 [Pseudomonadota bacterium]